MIDFFYWLLPTGFTSADAAKALLLFVLAVIAFHIVVIALGALVVFAAQAETLLAEASKIIAEALGLAMAWPFERLIELSKKGLARAADRRARRKMWRAEFMAIMSWKEFQHEMANANKPKRDALGTAVDLLARISHRAFCFGWVFAARRRLVARA